MIATMSLPPPFLHFNGAYLLGYLSKDVSLSEAVTRDVVLLFIVAHLDAATSIPASHQAPKCKFSGLW